MTARPAAVTGEKPCGFCTTRHHDLCPETILGAAGGPGSTWTCPCFTQGHTLGGQPPVRSRVTRMSQPARETLAAPAPAGQSAGATPGRARQARKTAASPFPEGVCSPYQFRAALVERGLVPASFRPQTVYTWVTQAARGGTFPVRWYTEDGELAGQGAEGTRPGVPVGEAVTWFAATTR